MMISSTVSVPVRGSSVDVAVVGAGSEVDGVVGAGVAVAVEEPTPLEAGGDAETVEAGALAAGALEVAGVTVGVE